ncbi:SUN domain-containing ossification factor isoform X2 [Zeugodacus cucurbitae]|uniref:SUN domain-containing ossification factor isoform X2 n=1 Tax=Zeugodacus cucurbitae TaxID=28588 RepID=UPI0010A73DC5|nr:SUN domain-containing ossification factor isoform X2 [Zeugodacus cucurbitae]
MRINLQLAYLGLLSVTCISSCLLFFVFLTENAKFVAACSDESTTLPAAADTAAVHKAAAASPAIVEITPIDEEVKKLTNNEREQLPTLQTAAEAVANTLNHVVDDSKAEPAEGSLLPSSDYSASASDNVRNDIIRGKINDIVVNEAAREAQENNNEEIAPVDVPAMHNDDLENVQAKENVQEILPDITEIPTITVTELPLEILEPTRGNIEALIIDAAKDTIAREHENHTLDVLENSSEVIRKDEEIIKFDDSGGGEHTQPTLTDADLTTSEIPLNIPIVNATNAAMPPPAATQNESASEATATAAEGDTATGDNNAGNTVNLTAEEVPIPVFSEWAQKQMEAAEKQQAKEQEVVNTATQKKNHTNGDGKRAAPLKMRNKNYASPDCGAKIIASNADASNTGAVLSSSKDEYMLSPCGNRIWFVVELCEAIQAQKVELANFELFSSSPKNFTVAVSNRFPTRDWSNVGRFIAEDKRNVQSFDLHPHLFGKFVRVDIHSHYSKEHFCPVSLFRVFGTSEFEAFETEDTPHTDLDDFDDDFGQEQVHAKTPDMNLFKSASDAVLSIVKKAAEVLVKPANQQNTTLTRTPTLTTQCRTPAAGQYNCADCSQPLVARINNALSCEYQSLQALLKVPWLLKDLLRTRICAKDYGIELKAKSAGEQCTRRQMDVKNSYYLNLLPREYVGALCQMLATQARTKSTTTTAATDNTQDENVVTEPPLNLTIDKKLKKADFGIIDGTQKKLVTPETTTNLGDGIATESAEATFSGEGATPTTTATTTGTTESGTAEAEQIARPPQVHADDDATTTTTTHAPHTSGGKEPAPDVNIFNVPAHDEQQEQQIPTPPNEPSIAGSHSEDVSSGDSSDDSSATSTTTTTSTPPVNADTLKVLADSASGDNAPPPVQPTPTTTATPALGTRSEEDAASWENIDNLITSTTAAPSGGEANAHGSQPGVNLQQKIPSGPQSESVFIRLSNRIKALERNMSLSGQYLEELSRRYKKQVEELQLTLTQTVQTVRTLEEQNRRQSELQQMLAQRNAQLKDELDDLSLQVHACIVVIIFVGAFVFLVLMVSILFYRSMRRETKEVLALYNNANRKKTASAVAAMQKKLNRRKSFEDFSDHQQSGEKMRRPSEEALMILKESSDGKTVEAVGDTAKNAAQRERKISICYNGNMGGANLSHDGVVGRVEGDSSAQNVRQRRKGEKHSWPNTEHAQQQARRHLAQLNATNGTAAELMDNLERVNGRPPRAPPLAATGDSHNKSAGNKSKRKAQLPRRQASVSHEFMGGANLNSSASMDIDSAAEYDESLRLEEDDLDNFIPTSDLAYNEFMPEGPSGYQVDDGVEAVDGAEGKKLSKKLSRLTAPGFFKSPFGKSRNKLRNSKSTKHPHESTSWEWYRSKNSDSKPLSGSVSASGGFMRASPTVSLDSSSLSEILLPNSRTENSFRILEEAILSSGESIAASSVATTGTSATDNGNVFS